MASAKSRRRRAAFAALLAEWHAAADDYDTDCEEDPRPYLRGRLACRRFVCVTQHEGKPFFLPHFDTPTEAQARAVEYVNDDLYAEAPVCVVDLDSDQRWYPEMHRCPWRLEQPQARANDTNPPAA